MSVPKSQLAGSVIARIYLLIGLTLLGMIVAYFAVPVEFVERNRSEKELSKRHDQLQTALNELDRLALVTHVHLQRAESAPSGAPLDLIGDLALSSLGAIEEQRAVVAGLAVENDFPGIGPLADRLSRQVNNFLAQPGSTLALDHVLLVTEQLKQLERRAVEFREEESAGRLLEDPRWTSGLLLAVLASVTWAAVRIIRSSRSTLRDLSEAIRARDTHALALQRERDFAAGLVATAPVIILLLDPQGIIQHVNPYFEQLTGYRMAEIKGQEWFTTFLPARDQERTRLSFRTSVTNQPTRGNISTIVTRAGVEREIEWNDQPMRDAQDRVTGLLAVGLDITERRKSEQKYQNILETALDGFWAVTADGRLFDVNKTYCHMSGYSRDELLRMRISDLDTQDDAEWHRRHMEKVVAEGGDRIESRHRRKDGTVFDVEISAKYLADYDGIFVAFFRDITERKAAEEALRSSRQQLRDILDSMFAFVGLISLDGVLLDVNRSPLEAGGVRRDDAIGWPFWETYWWNFSPESQVQLRDAIHRAGQGEVVRRDFRIRVRGGLFAMVDAIFSPLRNETGRVVQVVGSGVDVTERTRAEEELHESRERYELAIRGTNDGIWDWNILTNENFFSDRWCEMLGYSRSEVPSHVTAWVRLIHRDDRAHVLEQGRRHLEQQTPYDVEFRVRTKSKQYRWFHGRGQATWNAQGQATRMVGSMTDIQERKAAEEALRATTARLTEAQRLARLGDWELDLLTGVLTWSDEVFRIFEIDLSEFGGTSEVFFDAVHPEDREIARAAYAHAIRSRQSYDFSHRLLMADGRIKFVQEHCEVRCDAAGRPIRTFGTVQDITEHRLAEQRIEASLREKETLLREVHHRVKNNLQIISSLLHFQMKKAEKDVELTALREGQDRLRAMILVHEQLYLSADLHSISFDAYIQALVEQLRQSFHAISGRIDLAVDSEEVRVPVETALPCGMIVTELVTNAFKYAYPDDQCGPVLVRVAKRDAGFLLSVVDWGAGLPADFDLKQARSFGLQLVVNLADQLGAVLVRHTGEGTEISIEVPLHKESQALLHSGG